MRPWGWGPMIGLCLYEKRKRPELALPHVSTQGEGSHPQAGKTILTKN